jgi:hypothetical protein
MEQNVVPNIVAVGFLGFKAEVFEAAGLFNLIEQARRRRVRGRRSPRMS